MLDPIGSPGSSCSLRTFGCSCEALWLALCLLLWGFWLWFLALLLLWMVLVLALVLLLVWTALPPPLLCCVVLKMLAESRLDPVSLSQRPPFNPWEDASAWLDARTDVAPDPVGWPGSVWGVNAAWRDAPTDALPCPGGPGPPVEEPWRATSTT